MPTVKGYDSAFWAKMNNKKINLFDMRMDKMGEKFWQYEKL